MGSKPKQDPDNPCDLSESVIWASDKSSTEVTYLIPEWWRGMRVLETFGG